MAASTTQAEAQRGSRSEPVEAGGGAVQVQALEVMSDLLLGIGEGSPPDAFFSSLCDAICRLTSMKRAVLFRYDTARRRVRAVGAHGIELERFAELFVTIDSVPVARQALLEDRVLEVRGVADVNFDMPASLREILEDVCIICTPMAAGDGGERAPAAVDTRQGHRHGLRSSRGDRL
jgi:hypothetical protein